MIYNSIYIPFMSLSCKCDEVRCHEGCDAFLVVEVWDSSNIVSNR
jgi:hypothetical protein